MTADADARDAARQARRIVLARHGETAWTGRRYAGHADVPLTEFGRGQARGLAARLAASGLLADPGSRIVASPLTRALETARTVGEVVGRPVLVDPRWREVDFGGFEGRTFDEAAANWPSIAAQLLRGETAIDWPDGERFDSLRARIAEAWAAVVALDGPVLVVSHGIAIRTALSIALEAAGAAADGPGPSVLGPADALALRPTATGWAVDAEAIARVATEQPVVIGRGGA